MRTQVKCAVGSLNQLPPWVEISGDIRLTPFYEVADVHKAVDGYITDLNANITSLPTWGPCSKYEIEEDPSIAPAGLQGDPSSQQRGAPTASK